MIRLANPEDRAAIRAVQLAAFPTAIEADLVDALTAAGDSTLSLVAEQDGHVVGHILCSRMNAVADGRPVRAVGLAPLVVHPDAQGRGIGGALIREALARSRADGEEMLFVLGEPEYYGRFGFSAELARPFASPYAGEYFMALRLVSDPSPSSGCADYAAPFAAFEEAERD